MALQPITGYPSSWKAPFVAAEILLGQGPSSAAAGPREACYVAPMLAAGANWTANTLYPVGNEQDVINGAGVGSPIHRQIRKHLMCNPRGKLYALPYLPSSGAGLVSATGTITYTSAPTATGQTQIYVCGELITSNFTSSSTVTTIAADVAAKINAKVWLPVTATPAVGVVTLTAKIGGASQNSIIRFRALIDPGKTTTVATSGATVGTGTGTAGVDGATAESTNLAAALATIVSTRLYYLGFTVLDGTNFTAIKTHVSNKNAPSPGLTCRAFVASVDTLANALTRATALNTELMHIAWQKNSEHDACELSANLIASTQLREELDTAFPGFDGYARADWQILPAYAQADWPTDQDKQDAATGGLCTITSNTVNSQLVMHVTTRSKDSTGVINDFRATETHRVSAMHDFADTIKLQHYLTYTQKGFNLQTDPLNADGTVDVNAVGLLPAKVLTPYKYRPWYFARLKDFVDAGKFQNLKAWQDGTRINVDPANASRLEVGSGGRTVDVLHQTSFRLAENSPG